MFFLPSRSLALSLSRARALSLRPLTSTLYPVLYALSATRYLTVEQALADFAEITLAIREKWNAPPETAVVTFGGSYVPLSRSLRVPQV